MPDSRRHWSKIGESGSLLGMRLMLLAYRVFGYRGFRLFLFPVIFYYYLSRPRARRASAEYLGRVAARLPAQRREGLSSFRHFMSFGESLLDKVLAWTGEIGRHQVKFEMPEMITEFENSRSGGIIIVSHLGNFEVCGALARDLPHMKLTMLVHTQHAQKFNRVLNQAGARTGIEIMQVGRVTPATAMLLAERIEAGEYVVIAGDRTPLSGERRTTRVPFLGHDAALPQGAFILAGLMRCPVYLMFCLKLQGVYHLYIEKFTGRLEIGRRATRQAVFDDAVRRYAARLEYYCLLAPLQWFNFFPYWDSQRKATTGAGAGPGSAAEPGGESAGCRR